MEDLVFSLNATLPIFFLMLIGYGFKRCGIISERFATDMNAFVFKVALPVSLFSQLYDVDFFAVWDTSYVLFCFFATLICIGIGALCSLWIRNKADRGEFIQGTYRSSASLLGMAYIENIYGTAAMGSLMMLGSVPLYNVMAVIILSLTGESGELDRGRLKKSLIGILTNPIIDSIFIGFIWALLRIPLPAMAAKTVGYVGRLASPMGLLSMGACLNFGDFRSKWKPVTAAAFFKLIGFTALCMPVAVYMGFRGEKLLAALIMLGSASTVAGFIMAKNMGHEGTVSSGCVILSTILSSFTMTFWIWLLRSHGLL
ncbi:MAG: AEC family transporter [Eubacteriales bacterium]|nr:AEC family transporter [Eubacteriales bacterium]